MANDEVPVGRKLDVAIAIVIGWTDIGRDLGIWGVRDSVDADYGRSPSGIAPHYSSNLDTAFTLGAQAARLGFGTEYTRRLFATEGDWHFQVGHDEELPHLTWFELGELMHATAAQRATAFYVAWREWSTAKEDGQDGSKADDSARSAL